MSSFGKNFIRQSTGALCIYFFLLNLLSGLTVVRLYSDTGTILSVVSLAGIIAFITAAVCCLFNRIRRVKSALIVLFGLLFNVLTVTDFFMLINFKVFFNQDAMDVLADTTAEEAVGFLRTYLTFGRIVMALTVLAAANLLLVGMSRLLSRWRYVGVVMATLAVSGCVCVGICCNHYIRYGNGRSIPQCNSLVRVAYSAKVVRDNKNIIRQLSRVSREAEASTEVPFDSLPDIVVVIGESHSVFHSQLYGYSKPTEPHMSAQADSGRIFVFSDAVTPWDITIRAMQAIFPTADTERGLTVSPMFPALFKNAGYETEMFDNQYVAGKGISILSDPELSEAMFTRRNKHTYGYDINMVNSIRPGAAPALYVIHLIGQHYTYADRYSTEYKVFTPPHV